MVTIQASYKISLLWILTLLIALGCSKPDPSTNTTSQEKSPKSSHAHADSDDAHGPHDGVVAQLTDKKGFIEVKLHDDKGDLELWIAQDEKLTRPLDIPLNASIQISFVSMAGKTVELHPRNNTHNEDENGTPNLRNGKTNYFIFPSSPDTNADWLKGAAFTAEVKVTIKSEELTIESATFTLKPHHAH